MPRLLVICRSPYHMRRQEAETWLAQEVEGVLRRDELQSARLTRLRSPTAESSSGCEWLVEFRFETGSESRAFARGGALRELVADLRLLGMQPNMVLADDREAIELRPS